MLRVFHREHTGRPLRVVWTLEELGQPYELTVMNWEPASMEEHLVRHPLNRVPVLQDDDGFVFESAAICMHLADLYPQAGLLPPPASHERALAYQWSCFAPAELEPPLVEAATQADRDPERAARASGRFGEAAKAVAGALDGRDYLVAGRFGVADVLVGSALAFTARAGPARAGLDEKMPATLKDYVARLQARPAYKRASARTRPPTT
jgi:glutathione S-transferase